MNKIQKSKAALISIGCAIIVLAIASLCGGIVLLSTGLKVSPISVVKVVFGSILSLIFAPAIVYGVYFTWIGLAMTATKGNVKVDNSIATKTVNMKKCDVCGVEIAEGDEHCANCGEKTAKTKLCECGAENKKSAKVCTKCGKKF